MTLVNKINWLKIYYLFHNSIKQDISYNTRGLHGYTFKRYINPIIEKRRKITIKECKEITRFIQGKLITIGTLTSL